MTQSTTMQPNLTIVRHTPNTEELGRIAYDNMLKVMGRNLENGKHTAGGWNEGSEANPRWHLHRCMRHCQQAIMIMDWVEMNDKETVETHVRHALARATLALAQVTNQ